MYFFIKKSKALDFNNFLNEFPELRTNFSEIIRENYSVQKVRKKTIKKEDATSNLIAFG